MRIAITDRECGYFFWTNIRMSKRKLVSTLIKNTKDNTTFLNISKNGCITDSKQIINAVCFCKNNGEMIHIWDVRNGFRKHTSKSKSYLSDILIDPEKVLIDDPYNELFQKQNKNNIFELLQVFCDWNKLIVNKPKEIEALAKQLSKKFIIKLNN